MGRELPSLEGPERTRKPPSCSRITCDKVLRPISARTELYGLLPSLSPARADLTALRASRTSSSLRAFSNSLSSVIYLYPRSPILLSKPLRWTFGRPLSSHTGSLLSRKVGYSIRYGERP